MLMYQRLFIGNKRINLEEVDSTNSYMKQLIFVNDNTIEGLVVVAKNQFEGRGQQKNIWESEKGKNLIFSIFLKPNIEVGNQFLLSKLVSLGIVDFLLDKELDNVKIKWPNDIYIKDEKLSGILIENSIKGNKIYNSIVGIGLNVNQINFPSAVCNPTSLKILKGLNLDIEECLNELLFFIEKRYLMLKSGKIDLINKNYLEYLYWLNQPRKFLVSNEIVSGIIIGVYVTGKLQLKVNDKIEAFDLKEIEFLEK